MAPTNDQTNQTVMMTTCKHRVKHGDNNIQQCEPIWYQTSAIVINGGDIQAILNGEYSTS